MKNRIKKRLGENSVIEVKADHGGKVEVTTSRELTVDDAAELKKEGLKFGGVIKVRGGDKKYFFKKIEKKF